MLTRFLSRFQTYSAAASGNSLNARLKKEATDYARIVAINTLCALVLTYVFHAPGSLFENWVFSMCIGSSAHVLINIAQYLIWRGVTPHKAKLYALCLLMAPVAFFLGLSLAASLFDYPVSHIIRLQFTQGGSIGLTILISLLVTWYFWNRNKLAELQAVAATEKARSAAIERQAMQAQLQLLQAQIEPHMLFNTLANLQGLIALDQQKAQHMLTQLIVYLRTTLSSARAESTTLQHEFALMQAYLELLAIRMGKRLRYSLELPAELRQLAIAPMLLQPLVENAIKHGIEPNLAGGAIHVSASKDEHYLHLVVADTGLGLPFNYSDAAVVPSADGLHVGNANIRERLQALYGATARLSLTPNHPEGALAHLYLPLHPGLP